jgi:hypothetical protein
MQALTLCVVFLYETSFELKAEGIHSHLRPVPGFVPVSHLLVSDLDLHKFVCCDICVEKSIKCDHHLKMEDKGHLLSPLLVSSPSSFHSSNFCSYSNNNPLKTTISPCLYLLIFTRSFWSIFLHVLHLLSWRDSYYGLYLHDRFDEIDIREAIIPSILV